MPQSQRYIVISNLHPSFMQSLTFECRQPEPPKSLAELPVRERKKIQPNHFRTNLSAADVMGLSWIFVEDDSF